jgi:hypothetical protein
MAAALLEIWLARKIAVGTGCFEAQFALGITCAVLRGMVGCFQCKRRAVLFRALQSCTSSQWQCRTAFYSILAQ